MHSPYLFFAPIFFAALICHALALTAPNIQVTPVRSSMDLVDLGNLRYQEWMMEESDRPSPVAFRMATAEVQQERMEQNAVAFLARNDNGEALGSAELSPIELRDCYAESDKCCFQYVTDVVTAKAHRRKGVAATLMTALEQHARMEETKKRSVFLVHVKHDNEAALDFYKALGYQVVVSAKDTLTGLDVNRLAENAGVSGQLLLSKTLDGNGESKRPKTKKKKAPRGVEGGGKGFGR